ncbi:hypothetical protein D9M72_523900 [compost metagenome]
MPRPRGRSICPTPRRIRPSPTCRKPAKRSTTRSSACRSCARAARLAFSSSRTRRCATIARTRSRRSRRRPWFSPRWWRPVSSRRSPSRASSSTSRVPSRSRATAMVKASALAMSSCTNRGSSSPTSSTRTPTRNCSDLPKRWGRCASRSTTCCRAARCRWRASTGRCSKPTACSPMIAAGCASSKRRSATA